jgi:hypothetical protein
MFARGRSSSRIDRPDHLALPHYRETWGRRDRYSVYRRPEANANVAQAFLQQNWSLDGQRVVEQAQLHVFWRDLMLSVLHHGLA